MNILHDLINRERRRRHLPQLRSSHTMSLIALRRARDCARTHRLVHSYDSKVDGEALAVTSRWNPHNIVNAWLESPQHREILLSRSASTDGLGTASDGRKLYISWVFSRDTFS